MDLLSLKVKNVATGEIFGFSKSGGENSIIEIHFCTSYFHFIIQTIEKDEKNVTHLFIKHLICPFENANPVDLLCIGKDELGEIVA
jgi:hypothetical protein